MKLNYAEKKPCALLIIANVRQMSKMRTTFDLEMKYRAQTRSFCAIKANMLVFVLVVNHLMQNYHLYNAIMGMFCLKAKGADCGVISRERLRERRRLKRLDRKDYNKNKLDIINSNNKMMIMKIMMTNHMQFVHYLQYFQRKMK